MSKKGKPRKLLAFSFLSHGLVTVIVKKGQGMQISKHEFQSAAIGLL